MTVAKKYKILYWTVTLPFLILMGFAVYNYFTANPQMIEGLRVLGYPVYMPIILGIAKTLGILAILYNRINVLKEWAYAGFTINLIGASLSHYFVGDPMQKVIIPLIGLVLLLISYYLWKKKKVG